MRMAFQKFAHAAAKNAGAMAMDDAHPRQPGEKGVVKILFEFVGRFIQLCGRSD